MGCYTYSFHLSQKLYRILLEFLYILNKECSDYPVLQGNTAKEKTATSGIRNMNLEKQILTPLVILKNKKKLFQILLMGKQQEQITELNCF